MFVLHVALQGCLRARDVQYGMTADTGGHIRYLLDLVNACEGDAAAGRIAIATRRFESEHGPDYAGPGERVSERIEIVRLATAEPGYLAKEELWREVPVFAEALIGWIERQDRPPDVLHAHYADAGTVAAIVKARTGIPFVFTAHSLGLVKAGALQGLESGTTVSCPDLSRRIAAEEHALAAADLVVASSRDEAELQYAGYRAYDPGRIRILPPGSDVATFAGAEPCLTVDASIARFLTDPGKPVILALARPVAKKNLPALVRAYGECPELQARANLVIFAGSRGALAALDPEMAGTMRTIFELVDRYDLYGKVAYPKTHRPGEVAAIYAHARERGGVFVNPALNEPFGLTLLEAAAAGLPLVATDSGGPNDIVETCGNGILVNPRRPEAIAQAALSILSDPALWERFSRAGRSAASAYDWPRHAERYHGLVRSLLHPEPPVEAPEQLLVCDIDNTLVGGRDCLRRFSQWRGRQRRLAFGVATGRSFHSAMAILEQQDAPRPQVMITSVGSEIYHLDPNGTTYSADAEWRAIVAQGWDRDAVANAMEDMPGVHPQAHLEQRAFKLSYFTEGTGTIVHDVRRRLKRAGLLSSVIHSHGRYLDILPLSASKGTAVDFVRRKYALPADAVFVAGDSGNDVEMLRTVPQAIIVANFSDDIASRPGLSHSYVARQKYALGIIEGVDHFRAKAACAPAR